MRTFLRVLLSIIFLLMIPAMMMDIFATEAEDKLATAAEHTLSIPFILACYIPVLGSLWDTSATPVTRLAAAVAGVTVAILFRFAAGLYPLPQAMPKGPSTTHAISAVVLTAQTTIPAAFAITMIVLRRLRSAQTSYGKIIDVVVCCLVSGLLLAYFLTALPATTLWGTWLIAASLGLSVAYISLRSNTGSPRKFIIAAVIFVVLTPTLNDMFRVASGSIYLNHHS